MDVVGSSFALLTVSKFEAQYRRGNSIGLNTFPLLCYSMFDRVQVPCRRHRHQRRPAQLAGEMSAMSKPTMPRVPHVSSLTRAFVNNTTFTLSSLCAGLVDAYYIWPVAILELSKNFIFGEMAIYLLPCNLTILQIGFSSLGLGGVPPRASHVNTPSIMLG